MATRSPKVASQKDSEPDRLAIKRYAAKAARLLQSNAARTHATHGAESVRTADHDGHRITVRTHYSVEVDGRRLDAGLAVDLDGQVTCHAIPAYSYPSAVDIVKRLIDTFPDDFPTKQRRRRAPPEGAAHEHAPPKAARPARVPTGPSAAKAGSRSKRP